MRFRVSLSAGVYATHDLAGQRRLKAGGGGIDAVVPPAQDCDHCRAQDGVGGVARDTALRLWHISERLTGVEYAPAIRHTQTPR
jgi:hypothetical protein